MLEALNEPIRRFLRVPGEPDPPLGAAGSLRVFRADQGFYRYRLLAWGWKQAGAIVGLVFGFAMLHLISQSMFIPAMILRWIPLRWLDLFEGLAVLGFLAQLPVTFLLLALDYRYRWYLTTDRSLRIREGIWKVRERTMTYSNIQNVEIRQGPLQRYFGIADLRVQTAGGGGKEGEGGEQSSADHLHVGRFRGIANAEEVRDGILAELRRLRDSGLGDPDEPAAPAPGAESSAEAELAAASGAEGPGPPGSPVLDAARELLRQTRLLAADLRRPG